MSKEYIILSEKGFDSYLVQSDAAGEIQHSSHYMTWSEELSAEDAVVTDADTFMREHLPEGHSLETLTRYYVKRHGSVESVAKVDVFFRAVKMIVESMETLQIINGFLPMTPSQRLRAEEYVQQSLSLNRSSFGKEFRFPVFASFNYLKSDLGEMSKSYMSIETDNIMWKEAMQSIKWPQWLSDKTGK